MEIIPH